MSPTNHRLAAIRYDKGFDIDALLVDVCRELAERGVRLGGLLQISEGGVGGCATSVHLYDLQTRTAFDIWEDRGSCARGCRLDETGLHHASSVLDRAISDQVDLLIINRFGRAESLGRGLLGHFAKALETNVPILTSVREPYDQAWHNFHGGLGMELPCARHTISVWARNLVGYDPLLWGRLED